MEAARAKGYHDFDKIIGAQGSELRPSVAGGPARAHSPTSRCWVNAVLCLLSLLVVGQSLHRGKKLRRALADDVGTQCAVCFSSQLHELFASIAPCMQGRPSSAMRAALPWPLTLLQARQRMTQRLHLQRRL